ncbi:unnamed protein product [Pylaiella littoralis]
MVQAGGPQATRLHERLWVRRLTSSGTRVRERKHARVDKGDIWTSAWFDTLTVTDRGRWRRRPLEATSEIGAGFTTEKSYTVCVLSSLSLDATLPISGSRRSNRGHTGGSQHRIFFFFLHFPPRCLPFWLSFYREKGDSNPFPSSMVRSNFVYSRIDRFPLSRAM